MFARTRHLLCLTALAICWQTATTTYAQPKKKQTVFQETVTTNDGWPLKLTYYKHEGQRNAPAVILLHSHQGDKRIWTHKFAEELWKEGFAVVAVDLRKHGESKLETVTGASSDIGDLKRDDYVRMVTQDMEAVKDFLMKEHQAENLNIRKTGIVAPEMSAPIALNFTREDWRKIPYDDAPVFAMRTPRGQDIRALVLISPDATLPGMSSALALRELRDPAKQIAFLFCVGEEDSQDRGETRKMYQLVSGRARDAAERIFYETYPYNLRGMALIGKNLKIEAHITVFLKKNLLELEDPWQDRRSRLER
ncbi:alpha/beta hydrolase [Rubinisphaera sp. JC750]|uniref:alpha/beta hydrolase n=1 Tax=Rubinisphaera sp. JC750 TaxID=2898658 RepID=UPI001F3BA7CB|nr:hypothetical protein [Rubinisphaera sp. JC750]